VVVPNAVIYGNVILVEVVLRDVENAFAECDLIHESENLADYDVALLVCEQRIALFYQVLGDKLKIEKEDIQFFADLEKEKVLGQTI